MNIEEVDVNREETVHLCEDIEAIAVENGSWSLRDQHSDSEDNDSNQDDHYAYPASNSLGIFTEMSKSDGIEKDEAICYTPTSEQFQSSFAYGCVTSRPCTVCVYLVLILVVLCSFISLFVISFLVAVPYHRAVRFLRAQCVCVESAYALAEEHCSCGKGCSSRYPCLTVNVNVSTSSASFIASLANDETLLHKKCTFYPHCRSTQNENKKTVQEYERSYGQTHQTYSCFYNPHNSKEVIRTKRFRLSHVAHGLFWTSFLFVASLFLLVFMFRRRGLELV